MIDMIIYQRRLDIIANTLCIISNIQVKTLASSSLPPPTQSFVSYTEPLSQTRAHQSGVRGHLVAPMDNLRCPWGMF